MDPLLDEKIVLSLLRNIPEFFNDNLAIKARQEAFGPSRNEGLCYESCLKITITGGLECDLYFGLDGYTKMELLPHLLEFFKNDDEFADRILPGGAGELLLEFAVELGSGFMLELEENGYVVQMATRENLSHKLVQLDLQHNREYILIFFLTDPEKNRYLGRFYVVVTFRKY